MKISVSLMMLVGLPLSVSAYAVEQGSVFAKGGAGLGQLKQKVQQQQTAAPAAGAGANQMLGNTKISAEQMAPKSTGGIKFGMACTDKGGKSLKAGDVGFEQCMADAQTRNKPNQPGNAANPSAVMQLKRE